MSGSSKALEPVGKGVRDERAEGVLSSFKSDRGWLPRVPRFIGRRLVGPDAMGCKELAKTGTACSGTKSRPQQDQLASTAR